MRILIIAPYTFLPSERKSNRFLELSFYLARKGHSVTLVTSNFNHWQKQFRSWENDIRGVRFVLLKTISYRKNVSFSRYLSILYFAYNLRRWFNKIDEKPDVVYSAFPTISSAAVSLSYAKRARTKFVLDVQDIWPYSIVSSIPVFRFVPLIFLPGFRLSRKIFKNSDRIICVSDTYQSYIKNCVKVSDDQIITAFIGSKQIRQSIRYRRSESLSIFYIGSFGPAYNIKLVCDAVVLLRSQLINVDFHIFGGGIDQSIVRFKQFPFIKFHGILPYDDMMEKASCLDVAVNPISSHASQSVTNKLCDYIILNCPIINTHRNEEVIEILSKGRLNMSYIANDIYALSSAILFWYRNQSMFESETNFSSVKFIERAHIHEKIGRLIDSL